MATIQVNTGKGSWAQLEEYYTDNGEVTGREKANVPEDPDFVPAVNDDRCTVPEEEPVEETLYVHVGTGGSIHDLRIQLRSSATFGEGDLVPSPAVLELFLQWQVNRFGEPVIQQEAVTINTGVSSAQTTSSQTGDILDCVNQPAGIDITSGNTIYHVIYVYNPDISNCAIL